MSVKVEKLDNNEVKIDIVVASDVTTLEYDKVCKRLGQRVNIPGFRVGKAPKAMVEKHIGADKIQREVLEGVLPKIFSEVIEDNKFDVISEPFVEEFNFADDKTLTVKAKLELKPDVNLPDNYKSMEVEVEEYRPAENTMENELAVLQQKFITLNKVEGRNTTGKDVVNIDFEGEANGEKIKNGAAKGYMLDLEHNNFIPGFSDQLIDKELGSEFNITVKFPEEYHDDKLKGQDATFAIKINEIKEKVVPPLDDELAKKIGTFQTIDELKADIQRYIEETTKTENEKRIAKQIFDKLNEQVEIVIPDSMIQRESRVLLGELQEKVKMQGGDWDKVLEKEGHEKIWEGLSTEAQARLKNSLIIGRIAELENIQAEAPDLEQKIDELVRLYQRSRDEIIAELQKNPNLIYMLSQQVVSQKVTQFLINSTKVKYTSK